MLKSVGNYLRVRGEYPNHELEIRGVKELPPRARRILTERIFSPRFFGTTSACAENTDQGSPVLETRGNYLRVRGEYRRVLHHIIFQQELPPRARRIHDEDDGLPRYIGTTSACAENTKKPGGKKFLDRNYLRVRGEYHKLRHRYATVTELPPRARRIPQLGDKSLFMHGTTSACAENTPAPNTPNQHQ